MNLEGLDCGDGSEEPRVDLDAELAYLTFRATQPNNDAILLGEW